MDDLAAHGALIVTVETDRLREASQIAYQLVEPVKAQYVEVLVYFRRPGTMLADTRVQWTPDNGYITSDIAAR